MDRDEARGSEISAQSQQEMMVTRTNPVPAREGRGDKAESEGILL